MTERVTARMLELVADPAAATRTTPDRLEILQALIAAPTFAPEMRDDVIRVAPDHPIYGWRCQVPECERGRAGMQDFCHAHDIEWSEIKRAGGTVVDFFRKAQPLHARARHKNNMCLVCSDAPAYAAEGLCYLHVKYFRSWQRYERKMQRSDDLDHWLPNQVPFPDFGQCRVVACGDAGVDWIGLCYTHLQRYNAAGRPGAARNALRGKRYQSTQRRPVKVLYNNEAAFNEWCRHSEPLSRTDGTVTLLGLRPLVRAEIKWALFRHANGSVEGAEWPLLMVQNLARECLSQRVNSLADLNSESCPQHLQKIHRLMLHYLRLVYFTRQDTREAGYIEMEHYGVCLTNSGSYYDISRITQRWLRDMLWDWIDLRLTTDPPRSVMPLSSTRRGCIELSAYLEAQAPAGGHDPALLTRDHMIGFVADQRHRAAHGLKSLGLHGSSNTGGVRQTTVTKGTMSGIFSGARRVLRGAMDSGTAHRIGLDQAFIVALPHGGHSKAGRRKPYSDETARALANETNLQRLDSMDAEDRGLRDIWEALVVTGRRCSEVLKVRLECVSRLNGLPMFWHDQTKVGNFDEGIRISERLYQRILERQRKTIHRFIQRFGREPDQKERLEIALFVRRNSNRNLRQGMCYSWFHGAFKTWVSTLDIPHSVTHQARHTLATNLIKNGADLTHVKRYLGQVSEAMAEHYVHLASIEPRLEDALQAVWVGGPGSAEPGILLSGGEPMTREEALALAVDLSRRSTPAEGGFCTYQPVVSGEACPWNLDCHNCDKFVMSGADLVYWHRKREQWRTVAEGAPDSATADYLHELFEPTSRAIDGLEKALGALGLLDEALALDLRRPQDYFGLVWSTAFRARELAQARTGGIA
ncbi:tyrosine-type recombinase/integrase [Streptomyces sp. NPDC056669]|uniref:tyrosine-type recombinase/integrase n=1 Tax=Streptomyces sp. NPDC056669 TaxID=3345903 RepID=UPI0036BEFA10